ncbi:MAG TPA: amino acid adenylation domain-containing protein, partial [Cellvibrio sp.]|nr:amino acid adenylation domain-containing protein [Cellvibrio sp.]
SQYSGERDVVVGSPIAGRKLQEVESLVGLFVNTIVVRNKISDDQMFVDLLAENKNRIIEALQNQDVPFERVVEDLSPGRSLSHSPVFQIKLDLHNLPEEQLKLSRLKVEPVVEEECDVRFDLELFAYDVAGTIKFTWKYRRSLFNESTIQLLAATFRTLLCRSMVSSSSKVGELKVYVSEDQARTLSHWNDTSFDYRRTSCLHHLFEQQAARTPEAVAVRSSEGDLSYRDLNIQANKLAHYLAKQGIGTGSMVALCVERSVEMVVGILGILKAGAAYVPIDPAYPRARIDHILDETGIELVLTKTYLTVEAGLFEDKKVLPLESELRELLLTGYPTGNPGAEQNSASLAYVIYTSGSTGRPKGVMVEHRALVNYLDFAQHGYYDQALDGSLVFTSYGFDLTLPSIYLPLISGGCVGLINEGRELEDLAQALRQAQSNYLLRLTPSHVAGLLAVLDDAQPCAGRHVFVIGGEILSAATLARLRRMFPEANYFNHYGPTESVIGCSFYRIQAEADLAQRDSLPIGKPMGNTKLYVLDGQLRPQPIGCPGELYVGGEGLALGYLGQPQLTQERFVRDPFVSDGVSRLYKTGDLARWLPDGYLDFLGRCDDQVKIRGFRIELGEIESQLVSMDAVKESVVTGREDERGDKRLVAYIVPAQAFEGDDEAQLLQKKAEMSGRLRQQLKAQLPDYMVPAIYVFIERMPLTINGKIDRDALPAPKETDLLKEKYVAPRNPIEEKLCHLWQELLKLDQVGVEDNFFSLGGDSIVSIQLVTRAKKQDIHFTVRQLFELQTIAALMPVIKTGVLLNTPQGAVQGKLNLLPSQHAFFERQLPAVHHYNQAVLLNMPNGLMRADWERIVAALYQRHDALRLQFIEHQGEWQAQHRAYSQAMLDASLEYHDLSSHTSPAREAALEAICASAQAALDIGQGPLLKALYIANTGDRQGEGAGWLLLAIHHLVVDGVSWRILLADMEQAWAQLQQQQTIQLSPKTSSLQQWGDALQAYVKESSSFREEREYWLKRLALPVKPLPRSEAAPRPGVSLFSLNAQQTAALLGESNTTYRTQINELMLAALWQAYQAWTGHGNLRIEMEGHGREEFFDGLDVSETLGWFTAVYPLILQAPQEKSWAGLIAAVKEQYRALPNKGVGYGLLKYIQRDAAIRDQESEQSSAEIFFNYLGQFDNSLDRNAVFSWAKESAGATVSALNPQRKPVSVEGLVRDAELRFSIESQVLSEQQRERFADLFAQALRGCIDHCLTSQSRYAPSDFPSATVDQETLDTLSAKYNFDKLYIATPMQEGLLFHALMDEAGGSYTSQFGFDVHGELDVQAFVQSWQALVLRHDVFRTCFIGFESQKIHQLVVKTADLPFTLVDLKGLPAPEQEQGIGNYLAEDRARGFNFTQPPLMRIALLRLSDEQHRFIWTFHHVLLDGWCNPIIFGELLSLYQRRKAGEELALPAPVPYQ